MDLGEYFWSKPRRIKIALVVVSLFFLVFMYHEFVHKMRWPFKKFVVIFGGIVVFSMVVEFIYHKVTSPKITTSRKPGSKIKKLNKRRDER